ncbi:MAG TPA: hypothetical protein VFA05_01355 [Gaiellaceae bacterium]|nr:hypothetical protein [Gaiellaceae bacterium]
MTLADELEAVAAAAAAHGAVAGVLAAEPLGGRRFYLVAFVADDDRRWLVVDEAAAPVALRTDVREVASIVAMCELAGDLAGGGDLDELRSRLAELRTTEALDGVEEAEEAALRLQRAVGEPPRVASPGYLDAIGAATVALERALGDDASPFAAALRAATGAVDEFVRDVERAYLVELR